MRTWQFLVGLIKSVALGSNGFCSGGKFFNPCSSICSGGIFMEPGYVQVALTSEIAVGKMKKVTVDDVDVLIVNVDGVYYALGAVCTHYAGDLSEGTLTGRVVTCPNHGSKFDVTTGKVVSPPVEPLGREEIEDEPRYLVKVEEGKIFLKL
jgi:nitrite reductase/ring-hydroxylating ferredoxin subunit